MMIINCPKQPPETARDGEQFHLHPSIRTARNTLCAEDFCPACPLGFQI